MKRIGLILVLTFLAALFVAPAMAADKIPVTGALPYYNIETMYRSFPLDLGAATVDSGNDVDDASAPNLTTADNVPAIIWDDSGETVGVQWTFRVPSDFVSGLTVYALVSSDDASGAGTKLDWAIWVNEDDTTFDAGAVGQDAVECTSATLDASNEVLTLTADATAEAAYGAGDWVTLEFFNGSTNDDDLELKGLDVRYNAGYKITKPW